MFAGFSHSVPDSSLPRHELYCTLRRAASMALTLSVCIRDPSDQKRRSRDFRVLLSRSERVTFPYNTRTRVIVEEWRLLGRYAVWLL
jgi:hypothetical protein